MIEFHLAHFRTFFFGIVGYIAPLVVLTADYALFQAANNTAVMTDIDPGQRGVMSGMLNLSRNLGLITGASVLARSELHGRLHDIASIISRVTADTYRNTSSYGGHRKRKVQHQHYRCSHRSPMPTKTKA